MKDYQTLQIDWQGIPLSVVFCPDYSSAWRDVHGFPLWHLTVQASQPLPISETGYRSCFVSGAVLEEWGGPWPYIRFWLDAKARSPEWQERQHAARQLSLF